MLPTSISCARFLSLINHRGEGCSSCVDGCTPCYLFICLPPEDISNYMIINFACNSQAFLETLPKEMRDVFFLCHTQMHLCLVFTQPSHCLDCLSPALPFCVRFPRRSLILSQRPEKLSLLQVTQDPRTVLPLRWEELVEVEGADLQLVFSSMAKQIQSLLAQRDTHLEVYMHTHENVVIRLLVKN